ncbi:DUF945 domain-containing protein [Comamonas testosteroni]|uniref:DUF945 domain-containing protein n=1 Tax=Comamonas testosteroni TaxID=285 RepID=A0A373FFR7_COMTE|nr:YdgA family protein [Comamonas testosteroni]RGE42332.1 DUF945 domain-containing protein [Comamonas testosteroni]
MSKKAGIGIAAAVVVVAAGAMGTSYYMGGKLQDEFTAAAARAEEHGVSVKITSYERGAFSSTAKTVWTLDKGDEPVQFTADHKISHGPLPMGHAAQIHTAFQLPADADEALKTALNGRSPLEVDTKLGWSRSSSNVMTSPAVVAKIKEDDMNWGGMKIAWDMPADMKAAKGTASFAGLQFKDEEGTMRGMEKAEMRFDVKRPEGHQFWTGPFAMTIAKFTATNPEGDGKTSSSTFEGITLDSDTILKTDVLEATLKGGIKSVKLQDASADDLALDVVFRNIDAGWLNSFMELSKRKAKTSDGEDGDDEENLDSDLRDKLFKNMTQALARKPAIEIKRISMRTPEGVSEFGANVEYLGNGEKMGELLKDIKVSVNANVPKPVLDSFLTSRKRSALLSNFDDEDEIKEHAKEIDEAAKEQAQASITALKEHGIFEDKDGKMSTQIVYANGEFQVNGKPLSTEGYGTLMGEALE